MVTSAISVATPGLIKTGTTAQTSVVRVLITASTLFYGQTIENYRVSAFKPTLSKFYYSSSSQASDTAFYMELSGITLAAYPAEYMEIVLYDLAATAYTTVTPTGNTPSLPPPPHTLSL